jgi:hypothetical protein
MTERALETTIEANEVPMATFTNASEGGVKKGNTAKRAGTTTKPPPLPNRPAVIPAIAPVAHNVTTNNSSSISINAFAPLKFVALIN